MVTFHKTEVQYHNQYIYINTTHWSFEITPVSLNLCLCVYMCVFSSIEFHHSQHLYIYISLITVSSILSPSPFILEILLPNIPCSGIPQALINKTFTDLHFYPQTNSEKNRKFR